MIQIDLEILEFLADKEGPIHACFIAKAVLGYGRASAIIPDLKRLVDLKLIEITEDVHSGLSEYAITPAGMEYVPEEW